MSRHSLTSFYPSASFFALAATLTLAPAMADAGDVGPTPAGAQKLSGVIAEYFGASSGATVEADGDHYTVSFDLSHLKSVVADKGFAVDPATVKLTLIEQSNGVWRFAFDGPSHFGMHGPDMTINYDIVGYKVAGEFDTTLGFPRKSEGGFDCGTGTSSSSKVSQSIRYGKVVFVQTGAPAAGGSVDVVAHQTIDGSKVAMNLGVPNAPAPYPISYQIGDGTGDVSFSAFHARQALDLWAFLVANPGRPALAAKEDDLKALLRALGSGFDNLNEKLGVRGVTVTTPKGEFSMNGATFSFATTGAVQKGVAEIHIAMDGLTLPAGVVPPWMGDLIPQSFDIGVKASGQDAAAALNEIINDMHLAGDGPIVAPADGSKVGARFRDAGPITIEILPTHATGAKLDLSADGTILYNGARPSGTISIHARNFDKTIEALKSAGPAATPQLIGGLAMAKGLAKTDANGALTWVAEMTPEGAIKVNGLPLGKAPN
jgi:hypothetical protein